MDEKKEIKIPVTILSGFLGAGKTTFLNHLLQENEGTRYAIIENEFGKEGIDNELIVRPDTTIVELNNGCLCCTLNDNLYDILNELFERREEFDELIIEATGVADPRGLAQPFIAHPLIKQHFPLAAIICLVDAVLVEEQLEQTEEAICQITFSDVLLINKIDLVSDEQVAALENRLQQLHPLATIVKGHKDHFPKMETHKNREKLEDVFFQSHQRMELPAEQWSFPVQKPHTPHEHKHTAQVKSHAFKFDQPFDFQILYQYLFVYFAFQSMGLYRMKGLVWLKNEDKPYVLQSVGKRLNFYEKRPGRSTEQKQSVLVFIGKNLQRQGLERMFNKCFSTMSLQAK
ncbi:MAG: GTP-binding protein [Bacteroidota bacterium]